MKQQNDRQRNILRDFCCSDDYNKELSFADPFILKNCTEPLSRKTSPLSCVRDLVEELSNVSFNDIVTFHDIERRSREDSSKADYPPISMYPTLCVHACVCAPIENLALFSTEKSSRRFETGCSRLPRYSKRFQVIRYSNRARQSLATRSFEALIDVSTAPMCNVRGRTSLPPISSPLSFAGFGAELCIIGTSPESALIKQPMRADLSRAEQLKGF